jgi:pimeloyl-ACP methyl ester carboxylesterase
VVRFLSPALAARIALDRFMKPAHRALDAVDAPLLATARLRRIDLDGLPLQLYEWGPRAAVAPRSVLLMHGWGSHAPRWSAFAQGIVDRGWRAVAFDAPAHGRSGGSRSSLWQFRAALDAVIDAAGPIDAAIAHSLGALALATRLADTAATPPLRAAVLVSLPPDLGYLLDSFLQLLDADAAFAARVHALFTQRFGRPASTFDSLGLSAQIHVPTLLVHDRDDAVTPVAHAERLAPLLPQGALYVTQGFGHSGMLRDAATVGAALGFLDGLAPRPAR